MLCAKANISCLKHAGDASRKRDIDCRTRVKLCNGNFNDRYLVVVSNPTCLKAESVDPRDTVGALDAPGEVSNLATRRK